jgi:hypothetical protein
MGVSEIKNRFLKIGYIPSVSNTGGLGWFNSTSQSALNSTHAYSLNVLLSGYTSLILLGNPSLYIDAVQYDPDYYLLKVIANNLSLS